LIQTAPFTIAAPFRAAMRQHAVLYSNSETALEIRAQAGIR
jgi:hypothetical protein